MKVWNRTGQALDSVNEVMLRAGWILVLYIMCFGLADVILRYVFNAPSLWIYLTLQFSMVVLVALCGGYALHQGAFVKMDVFYTHFSPRGKAIADIFTFVLTLLFAVMLIWKGAAHFMSSLEIRQLTPSAIPLPVYPIKAFIPVGGCLLLAVAVRKLISDIRTVLGKRTG